MNYSKITRAVDSFTATPMATAVAFGITAAWLALGPLMHFSDSWQLIMSSISGVVTFLMVFVLANAQARIFRAIMAKLDGLVLHSNAPNELIAVEHQEDDELLAAHEAIKEQAKT